MNKKVISVLIYSIIVFVSSTPIDSPDDGGKLTSNGFSYLGTESPKTSGPIVTTLAKVASRQVDETHGDKSEAPSTVPTGTSSSTTVPQSAPFNNSNNNISNVNLGSETTVVPLNTTTITPTTTPTTLTTTLLTTTTSPTDTTTSIPTTITTPIVTTKPTPSTTTTTLATTTAAAATTAVPTPTESPSKDRRFDGPSFIGGIVLSLGIMAIGFVAFKFYKARTERNYHTL